MIRAALAALMLAGAVHAQTPEPQGLPLPVNLGGAFSLIDQHGDPRTEVDPTGQMQLLFFGYATCQEICSTALPQMAAVAAGLQARGVGLTPVMITINPAQDTPQAMRPAMAKLGPTFVGLTGEAAALQVAYSAFSESHEKLFEDPYGRAVYAHGAFFYLLNAKGEFLTVIPPILTDARVQDIIAAYAAKS